VGAAGVVEVAEAAEGVEAAAAREAAGAAEAGGGEAVAGEAVAAARPGELAAGVRLKQIPLTFVDPGPGWPGLSASAADDGDTRVRCARHGRPGSQNYRETLDREKRQPASRTIEFWQPEKTPGTGGLALCIKCAYGPHDGRSRDQLCAA
jgi:hypothetical protein